MDARPAVLVLLVLACNAGASGRCGRRVCYYNNWSQYRPGKSSFFPRHIDPNLCTHLVFAFANIKGDRLAASEWNDLSTPYSKGMYERFTELKKTTPQLKTLLAVGGWGTGSAPFTALVATNASRERFARRAVTFLRQHNFDGLDLNWLYPADRGSPLDDKGRFTQLLRTLSEHFRAESEQSGRPRLRLTAAVGARKSIIDKGYDIPEISKYLDWIGLMSYDFHGFWDQKTGHNSPLYAYQQDNGSDSHQNVDWAARYWVAGGAPKHKLVIGVATYGRSFTLNKPVTNTGLGVPATVGRPGRYVSESGVLPYYEICTHVQDATVKERLAGGDEPYIVYDEDQWVGYEDPTSLTRKIEYIKQNGYGGVMVWTLGMDDFSGELCDQGKYPLIAAIKEACG